MSLVYLTFLNFVKPELPDILDLTCMNFLLCQILDSWTHDLWAHTDILMFRRADISGIPDIPDLPAMPDISDIPI